MPGEYQQHLEFYECTFDDDNSPAFVTADLNLHPMAPQKERPLLLRIMIPLLDAEDNGLPKTKESSQLYDLEQKLAEVLQKNGDAVLAGMIWRKAIRRLYY